MEKIERVKKFRESDLFKVLKFVFLVIGYFFLLAKGFHVQLNSIMDMLVFIFLGIIFSPFVITAGKWFLQFLFGSLMILIVGILILGFLVNL